jgi:hypothetical protein
MEKRFCIITSLFYIFLSFLLLFMSSPVMAQDNEGVFRILLTNCGTQGGGFVQTGFRSKWNSKEGIVTALHGVVGCSKYYATQKGADQGIYLDDLELDGLDFARDIAFLSSRKLSGIEGSALKMAPYDLYKDRLEVIGYPDGTTKQISNTLGYHKNPLTKLGDWHPQVTSMCKQRKSPGCNVDVLLVREDPLIPGHSGAPILNQHNQVVGIADGGIKGGYALLNWIIPYKDVDLVSTDKHTNDLQVLKQIELNDLFASPSTMDPSRFLGGKGTTISGKIMYGGYGSEPIGILSGYTKASAIIRLMETETRKEVPVDFEYNSNTGDYTIINVPSGKYTPSIRVDSGYPFYKTSGGDFISYLSGLNEDIVVPPHEKSIHRDINVVHSVHLKRPVDNQEERTFTYDPPEALYRQAFHPSASIFEWEPVPGAIRYEVRILLMNGATNKKFEEKKISTTTTNIMPNLKANSDDTYYMFSVTAFKGVNRNDLIGHFSNYYKNGFGGWFKFKILERPN